MTQAEQLLNEIARILLTKEGAERANAIDKQVADVAEFVVSITHFTKTNAMRYEFEDGSAVRVSGNKFEVEKEDEE